MKLNTTPRASVMNPDIQRELREHAQQVNLLSEGKISASYNAQAAVPTSGEYRTGDVVKNVNPGVLGAPGSQYVIEGWMWIGTAFVEKRFLTGT